MNHQSHLKKLLNLITKETQANEPFSYERGFYSGKIPTEFLSKEMKESEKTSLLLTGDEASLFNDSIKMLRNDTKTEYLKDAEIKDRLWFLVCEVCINKQEYRKLEDLKTKISEFIESICKPLDEYEVIFKINNLKIKKKTKIWDCWVVNYTKRTLMRKGFRHSNRHFSKEINSFERQALLLVTETGNNSSLVIDRARKKGNEIIKYLQAYLSAMPLVVNEQLLFKLSEDYAIKKKNNTQVIGTGWRRNFSPIEFDYEDEFSRLSKIATKHFELFTSFSEKLQNCIKRANLWIGKAVSEEDFDLKVAFLCTALETLLTTKQDRRKGEKIAYRTALLRRHFKEDITHPRYILQLYLTRNDIVHGSKIGIASKSEYHSLLYLTRDTLDYFVRLISQKNLKKQTDVLNLLINSEYSNELVNWIKLFSDENSKEVAKALAEDLEATNKS